MVRTEQYAEQLVLERTARRQEDAALAEARRQRQAQRAEALRTHVTPPSLAVAQSAGAGAAAGATAAAAGGHASSVVNRSLFTWNPPVLTAPAPEATQAASRSEEASSAWSWVNSG